MLLKLTNRDGQKVLVNPAHIATIEPITAHARQMSAVVFANVIQSNGQTKTLIVSEDCDAIWSQQQEP